MKKSILFGTLILLFSFALNAKSIEKRVTFVKVKSVDEVIFRDTETGKKVEISLECIDENELYDENKSKRKQAIAKLTSILKDSNNVSVFIDERDEYDYYKKHDREADGIIILNDKNINFNQKVIELRYGFVDYEESSTNLLCKEFNITDK